MSALEKYGFGKNLISWVKILLRNQESCVLNGAMTRIFISYTLINPEKRKS